MMFSSKLKPSDFYLGQPAQNLLPNEVESETLIGSSQSGPYSGSQKFELSQNPNSQDLFIETPGLNETVEHDIDIPKSAYDRYMHFNTFQQHVFPSKRCLQKTPSFSEVPDTKAQTNEEHSKKLDMIHSMVTEMLKAQKSLKNDMNSVSMELMEQKGVSTRALNLWDEKWKQIIAALELGQNTVLDIKNLAETTAAEMSVHKLEVSKFFKEEVPNVGHCLDSCVKENTMIMKQELDKTLVEICELREHILGKAHDMNDHLAVKVENILYGHVTSVTKQIDGYMNGVHDITLATLHSIQEEVKKLGSGRNINIPPYRSFDMNYNSHQLQIPNRHSYTISPSHSTECHLPGIPTPNSSYMPYNRNDRNSFMNNTFHGSSGNNEMERNFCDDIQFNIKRKNSMSYLFQTKPYSDDTLKRDFPSYHPKLKPLDMHIGIYGPVGPRKSQMNEVFLFDSTRENTYTPSNFDKLKTKPKRIKTESESPISMSGETVKNTGMTRGSNSCYLMLSNQKEHSNDKANDVQTTRPLSPIPKYQKGYMLRSRHKGSCKENSKQICLQAASIIENVSVLDEDDSCVIIDNI